jgi:hypothetical protein
MGLFGGPPLWSNINLTKIPKAHLKASEALLIARYRLPAVADGCQEEPFQRPEIDGVFVCASGRKNRGAHRVVRVDSKRDNLLSLRRRAPRA